MKCPVCGRELIKLLRGYECKVCHSLFKQDGSVIYVPPIKKDGK